MIFATIFTGGCQTWKDAAALRMGYENKIKAEGLLAQVKKEYEQKLLDQQIKINLANVDFTKSLYTKMQFASDKLYGADFAFQMDGLKDRFDFVVNNRVNEARAVLPPPTVEAMMKENEAVKLELDETRTSFEELKNKHNAALKEADKINEKSKQAELALEKAKQDLVNLEKEKNKKIQEKQDEIIEKDNKIIALEKQRADDRKALQEAKTKGSAVLGILALAALAGAIWSPLWKSKFGLFAGILGFAAIGIWYIEPWMVGLIGGICVLGLIVWVVITSNKENKSSTSVYQGLQSIKTNNRELWDNKIAPVLKEWQTKYVKKDGKIIEVDDPTIAIHIDEKLAETGHLDASKPKSEL